MKQITGFFTPFIREIKWLFTALFVFVVYKIYKKLKENADINKLQSASTSAGGPGVPTLTGFPTSLNLQVVLETLWHEQFETLFTTDIDKLISLVKSIPIYRMREFSKMYNEKVVTIKLSYHWWGGNWHTAVNFVEDISYFVGSRSAEISAQLNAI